ncbi:hypothetical protein FHL15_009538 [Xylaria flabelliformis]|uniref:Uncharacterized protein n=1 Tax=Xylaria flabelliformis TaxID=2512241 RepID=A0A553HP02_9PEZI|nr:hypothetical protein FHL15_009538 [Xylaria flabelliformis]
MANVSFAAEQPSEDPPGRKLVIILAVVVTSTVSVGVVLFCVWVRSRRHSNHVRLDDEQNLNEEPIPLQNLAAPEDGETAVHETEDPSVSAANALRPRTLNEYNKALNSNPPSQTDLATAQQALNSNTMIQKQDVGVPAIILSPPSPVLILPIPPQPSPSQEQSHLHPTRRSNSRLDDPRRHSKVFEFGDYQGDFTGDETLRVQSNLPPLPSAGPGIETMPNVLNEYHQQQRERDHDFPRPSTINEESVSDMTDTLDTQSVVELVENIPESHFSTSGSQSPEADKDEASSFTKRDDEPLSPSHEEFVEEDKANDADDEGDEQIGQTADSGASLEGGVQDSYGDSHDSYVDEVCNPKDPLYDVHGLVTKIGNNTLKAEQSAQTLSGDDNSGGNYTRFQRDYTNASLVPAPLVRRNNTIHETTSPAGTSTTVAQPLTRPASTIDVDISPLEPEIETQRPRSFVIREWPPQNNQDATFENAPRRQALWYTPPSQEIIEQSRRVREQMEWEEEAKKVVLQKAKDAGEVLSEEEITKRVRRMYERSSRFLLEAATYKPAASPAQPLDTVPADRTRVRAQRTSYVPPSGNANFHTNQKKRPVSSEPAFASSQALPFAASAESMIAQDGSRSGSPPPPRRRVRRSNPVHDLTLRLPQ